MCGHLTVAENIFLGVKLRIKGILDRKTMHQQALDILDNLGIDLDPNEIVNNLSVSKQQIVEIAEALNIRAKSLIMDEPTSALTNKEIRDLFRIILELKQKGCGIIYISHRLDELQHIVDRVTVMRDGKHIKDLELSQDRLDEIITLMVARQLDEVYPRIKCAKGKVVLEVKNLNAGPLVREINFALREGEIVGVAGLMGAGRTEMTRALFGADKKESGEVYIHGKKVEIKSPEDAIKSGLVLVPEERCKDGLCTLLSVSTNIELSNLDKVTNKIGRVISRKVSALSQQAIKDFNIKVVTEDVIAATLSGGNQQKVVIGKWLVRNAHVVIFDEATRGIDIAAKVEIYHIMNRLKE